MNIKCKKCEHKWNYKGKSKYYVTCPNCYNKINIGKELKIEKVNE